MNNFSKILTIAIFILFGVIIWQTCRKKPIDEQPPIMVTKLDTIYRNSQAETLYIPIPDTIEVTKELPVEYLPDTNYAKLKDQYDALAKKYLARKDYKDTLKLDSIGYVTLSDTIEKNEIAGRQFSYSYKLPTIIKTIEITKQAAPKNQVYVGGTISSELPLQIKSFDANAFLKNKKDMLYGAKVGIDLNGHMNYGVGVYFKIKL